jgi:hypothetical protein
MEENFSRGQMVHLQGLLSQIRDLELYCFKLILNALIQRRPTRGLRSSFLKLSENLALNESNLCKCGS